jgi:hypothetical protein
MPWKKCDIGGAGAADATWQESDVGSVAAADASSRRTYALEGHVETGVCASSRGPNPGTNRATAVMMQ